MLCPSAKKTLRFLEENVRRNDRDWFATHKEQYRELVEAPMLAEALGPTISAIDPMLKVATRVASFYHNSILTCGGCHVRVSRAFQV